jgi:predicted PurR-regulated permease PerM
MLVTEGQREVIRSTALAVTAFGVVVAGLVIGRSFLLPLAVAILLWNVLDALIQGIASVKLGPLAMPNWLAILLGIAAIAFAAYFVASILLMQADAVAAAWPRYVSRLETILADLTEWLGPERSAKLKGMISEIDLTRRVPGLLSSTQSIVTNTLLIIAYVGFLFAESGFVRRKIAALFPDERKAHDTLAIMSAISDSVKRYFWIKTLVSLLTAAAGYAVLRSLGIDFAETWALLLFLFNYIPNIGSIVAVAFPALLALVQFDTLTPFFILVASLTAIQVLIGSVLEPMLMGKSLNISPFAIILGLAFWGTIWGIPGMFLSVPILVVVMIICAHVPRWRWIAIMLSKDGEITT